MPTFTKTHDQNRDKVCTICFSKGSRRLTDTQKSFITKNIFPDYEAYKHILPVTICNNCRFILASWDGPNPRELPKGLNYEQIVLDLQNMAPLTRTQPDCQCIVCNIGKSNLASLGSQLNSGSKRGRPRIKPPSPQATAMPLTICSYCQSEIGKGKAHRCTKTARLENVDKVLTPNIKDRLTSSNLRKKMEDKSGTDVSVATGGTPMNVSIGKDTRSRKKLDFSLPVESMMEMQISLNLSDRQVLEAGRIVRKGVKSRFAVGSNLQKSLVDRGKVLQPYFSCQTMPFHERTDQKTTIQVNKPAVICTDVKGLIEFLAERRDSEVNPMVKIGMDGGGGSLKICMNIIQKRDYSAEKRQTEGAKKFLDSGVKKLMIIAIAFDVQELYGNVELLLNSLNLEQVNFVLATDMKLANIVAGLQSHASKHPCVYCEGMAPWDTKASLRTLGRIKKCQQEYCSSGSKTQNAKKFFNCTNVPLLEGPDETTILDLLPSPELHLMLGTVNRIFDNLNLCWGEDKAYDFAKSQNIIRVGYRGTSMEGNQCKKLLQKVDALKQVLPVHLQKFATALETFNAVRMSCFGNVLELSYKDDINHFKDAYKLLEIDISPKLHTIFDHIEDFCSPREAALGIYSEQASEAVHSDFKHTWKRYSVAQTHAHFGDHLLDAVVKYNSLHI